MNKTTLHNKRLAILGLGVENYWLIKWLIKHKINCQITVCDQRPLEVLGDKFIELNKYKNITWQLGSEYNKNLDRYDILFRAPGWPINCPGITAGLKKNNNLVLTSPMRFFLDLVGTNNIIGVTGTKGKGTTSSLITAVLKKAGLKVHLGGNIGVAPFSFIDKLTKDDFVVLELSSFQLEDLHLSPHIAVLTNFYQEHLAPADPNNPNYHKTLSAYWLAKFNVAKSQTARDIFIINEKLKDKLLKWEAKNGRLKQRVIYFGKSNLKSALPGEHNKENIAAAEVVAKVLKIDKEAVAKAVSKFKSLEHRLELVKEINKVRYYDDSFATTPESAIIALRSFSEKIVLIAGGADKGSDFKELAQAIKNKTKYVCLLAGDGTKRLEKELININFKNYTVYSDLFSAMKKAKSLAKSGDVVLMSTGCASFGMFANYKERGRQFKEIVNKF